MNKRFTVVFTALLMVACMGFFGLAAVNAAGTPFEVGNKFEAKELKLDTNTYVLGYASEDVTGDGVLDDVILVGVKEDEGAIFTGSIDIIVKDGNTKNFIRADLKDFGGYGAEMVLKDFTGDKVKDIMISADTGGSGGIVEHVILSLKDGKPSVIFSEKENLGLQFKGKYVDGFKANLIVEDLEKDIIIDLGASKEDYVEGEIYDGDGKLLTQVEPYSHPFSLLEPVDFDGDEVYELRGHQRIVGYCSADPVSHVESVWKYDGIKWNVIRAEYTTFLVK